MKEFLILILVSIALSHSKDSKNGFFRSGNALDRHTDKYTNKDNVKKLRDDYDAKEAKTKAKAIQRAQESDERWNYIGKKNDAMGQQGFHIDPVLNRMNRRRTERTSSETDTDSRSSSKELRDWKEEWKEMWNRQKDAAMNATDPGGDKVVFVAARPWAVPCGDPTQHDMPWGTCMLPAECDAEYRIYRGDYFCGRTQFICCSLAFTTYDNYQGLDVSLDQSSMQTDSLELQKRKNKSKQRKKSGRDRKRRKRMREERKRKIRRTIARIVKEVRKILNKAYRNASKARKRKTKKMKKFIRFLKRQYRMDRNSVKDIHEHNLWKIDDELLKKLYEIKDLNGDFMTNETFRQVIQKKTMNFQAAQMLVEAYPELQTYVERAAARSGMLPKRRSMPVRRPRRRYLDYDVEYGLLYS